MGDWESWAASKTDLSERFGGPAVVLPASHQTFYPASTPAETGSSRQNNITVMSYNLLAPSYKRDAATNKEAADEAAWRARVAQQLLLVEDAGLPDVVGLQEYWCASPAYTALWRSFAEKHGYHMAVSPRTGGKQDGLCTLVRASRLRVRAEALQTLSYDDWGDRVAQVLVVDVADAGALALVNTHLTFPHPNAHDGPMRSEQARKLGEVARALAPRASVCLFGDMNGDARDPAVQQLVASGGLTPMSDAAGRVEDGWVSHLNHNGELAACDWAFAAGRCRVREWALLGSRDDLAGGRLPSDHRPLVATVGLDDPAAAEG